MSKRIIIATDAWFPQVNGVVRALSNTKRVLEEKGHTVLVIDPAQFLNFPCPIYPEIKLAMFIGPRVGKLIREFQPDHIHIATEGPIGMAVRRYSKNNKLAFTTSFHTLFPQYLKRMVGLPESISWSHIRRFHGAGAITMVPTPSIQRLLASKGLINTVVWSRGISSDQFKPRTKTYEEQNRPICMYVGRVSVEKNIEAFLSIDTPGTKYVVGDGPIRNKLEAKYRDVKFLGYKHGEDLAEAYANADVFVFPSLTDTFGNVLLEALASGVPVAAYPVTGPVDVITKDNVGSLNEDLGVAITEALANGDSEACVSHARSFTWEACTEVFFSSLTPAMN